MKTKGQFEILGLTFVVLLVMIGVIFGLYIMSKPERQLVREFSQSQLASNWLNAYKGTTTNCNNASVTDLISDCATSEQIRCPGGSSCDYLEGVTGSLLDATLGSWNRIYNFTIIGSDDLSGVRFSNGNCTNKAIQRDEQPVPTGAGTVFLRLTLC